MLVVSVRGQTHGSHLGQLLPLKTSASFLYCHHSDDLAISGLIDWSCPFGDVDVKTGRSCIASTLCMSIESALAKSHVSARAAPWEQSP